MKEKILAISEYAQELACEFASSQNADCHVHSVYERTINIELGGSHILAIQKESSPLSPLSLLIKDDSDIFSDRSIRSGDSVQIEISRYDASEAPGTNTSGDTNIDASAVIKCGLHLTSIKLAGYELVPAADTAVYETLIPKCSSFERHLSFRDEVLRRKAVFTEPGDLVSRASESFKAEAEKHYLNSDFKASVSSLKSLIGLGGGLTPAGDDFLSGVVCAIWSSSGDDTDFAVELFDCLRHSLDLTHLISAAFIKAALDSNTSIPLIHFISDPSTQTIDEVSCIGHSSGLDALEGFLFYARLANL